MATDLAAAFTQAESLINNPANLVRVVLSGRRRNMQVATVRIDIRPVQIKDSLLLQVASNDGRQTTTKNYAPSELKTLELLESGYANILVEHTTGSLSIRITKKGEALIHEDKTPREQNLEHDRAKERLLDSSDPYLIEVGISDTKGIVKPTRADKYRQVEEFLRLLVPTLNSAITAGHIAQPTAQAPLTIADHGCGNA